MSKNSKPKPGFDTLSLHAGQQPDEATGARATPIYQSASFCFEDCDHAAALFHLAHAGHVYSRISNPTNATLEERIAALENGVGALALASGQAALHVAITTLMGAGSHIVAARAIYGGSHNLLDYTMRRFGIETTFVDPTSPEKFAQAIQPNTRLIFAETVANPSMDVTDIPVIAEVAHAHGLPLLIDSTVTTPYLCRPFDLGADLVMHSATKFLAGHGTVIGGLLVDSGNFDWQNSGKFPSLSEPYVGFHGLNFAEEFGPAAFILRARREGLRDFGACLSPHSAFLILQGIETLSLRMQRHIENTHAVIDYLSESPYVEKIFHPYLADHPQHDLAKRLFPQGAGAVLSFNIKGGRNGGRKFIEAMRLFSHLANIGDAKSLVLHPASTTHSRMSEDDLLKAGISPGLIRLSIGLEDFDDLKADLNAGFSAVKRLLK